MKPVNNKIQLHIEEEKIGSIQSKAIQEQGKIIAMGPLVPESIEMPMLDENTAIKSITVDGFKIGATLYFKAWAVDIITEGDNKYYFISADSDAICGIKYAE